MATNYTKLIDRRTYKKNGVILAAAFIEYFPASGEVQVYGKFYDNGKGHRGPETGVIAKVPNELLEEVRQTIWQVDKQSPELQAWCNKIWQKAKEIDDWLEVF